MKIFPILLGVAALVIAKKIMATTNPKPRFDTAAILRLQSQKDAAELKKILISGNSFNKNVAESQFETIRNIMRNIANADALNSYFKQSTNVELSTAFQNCLSQSQISALSTALTAALKQKCVITAKNPTPVYYIVTVKTEGIKISRSGSILKYLDAGVFAGRCTNKDNGVVTVITDNKKRFFFESEIVLV